MSSEVCPFCGKTYKRLKSHLPHCKAAASSKTPQTEHDVTVIQTSSSSSSRPAAALTEPTAKGEKSTKTLSVTASPQSKKSKKASVVSAAPPQSSLPATPLQSANASSSSQDLSPSSALLPPSTKKKKPKLSEQIKAATVPSSTNISLISTQSPSPTVSKPKKNSPRALIEAAKSKQVSKGSLEVTRSASEDLPSGSTPLSSRTTAQTETKSNPDRDSAKDNAQPAFLSKDTKPKGASKMKVSKTKKAAQSPPTTKDTSSSLDSNVNEIRGNFLVDNEGGIEDVPVNKMFLNSGSGHQARITLQDVKATLGRANTTRHSSRPSILSQIATADDLSGKIRPGTSPGLVPLPTGNQDDVKSCLITTKTLSDQLPSTSSQHTELESLKRKSSKSKQASLIPLRHDGPPEPELASPTTPLPPGPLSSQLSQAKSSSHTVCMKVGHHRTGLPTISPSLTQFSSPRLFPLAPQTLPARAETLRADDGSMMKSKLGVRTQNAADDGTKGALAQRSLGQVRLRELPEWLSCKTPSNPRDLVQMVPRGWQWYYRRYIDVRKGGVGGLSMLLAGYCVLSYIWSYPHIKRDRWRKHH